MVQIICCISDKAIINFYPVETFTLKLRATWEKEISLDGDGRPIDPATECDGKPCNYPELVQYDQADISGQFCIPAESDQVICNYLPKNATLVPESGLRSSNGSVKKPVKPAPPILAAPPVLARNGSVPTQTSYLPSASKGYLLQPIQTPHFPSVSKRYFPKFNENPDLISASKGSMHKPAKTAGKLQKRSRWALDAAKMLAVWPSNKQISYGVWADDKFIPKVGEYMGLVWQGFDMWRTKCKPHGRDFFDNWVVWSFIPHKGGNKEAEANLWFYFVDGPVCGTPGAIACSFFPNMYTSRKTIWVNLKLFDQKQEKGKVLTLAHEIGHLIGLAHEDKVDVSYGWWTTSPNDKDSIMRWAFNAKATISKTDCRAMQFYAKEFKGIKCGLDGTDEKCKAMTKDIVDLKTIVLPRTAPPFKRLPRDELLADIDDQNCLGADVSKYFIIPPDDHGGYGSVGRGFFLSQCLADDGNLVIYDISGKPIWSSGTQDRSPSNFRLKTEYWQFRDGHMYIFDANGRASWGSSSSVAHNKVPIQQKSHDGGSSGYCLDAGKTGIPLLNKCNGSDNQLWTIFTSGFIMNTRGLCLADLYSKNESQVYLQQCEQHKNNQWYLYPDGTIRNSKTNMCLDNRGQQLQVGNPIQVYECFEVWSEKWWVGGFP
ncbi:MAG: hypothetical protein J3R72DRAFT_511502 [Linnemannia gamsii]|nr:MAG: hypothetical protein J3R72DRAFT_511502 [Linnemannia gamsii]